jgi:hypothetical protein
VSKHYISSGHKPIQNTSYLAIYGNTKAVLEDVLEAALERDASKQDE